MFVGLVQWTFIYWFTFHKTHTSVFANARRQGDAAARFLVVVVVVVKHLTNSARVHVKWLFALFFCVCVVAFILCGY